MSADEPGEKLKWSVKNGDVAECKSLVDTHKLDVNAYLSGGRAPIHYAGDMGQADVVEYLVSAKADVNKEDEHGMTALICAIYEDHTSTVEALLKAGASYADKKAPDGSSYKEAAESVGADSIAALLK
jgi:ankyrin repeat protein